MRCAALHAPSASWCAPRTWRTCATAGPSPWLADATEAFARASRREGHKVVVDVTSG